MLATAAPPIEITDAAIAGFRRLQDRLPFQVLAYERPDGGLVCEHRRRGSRPVFYRVTPAGGVEPDRPLDWGTLRFTAAALPRDLA